MVRPGLVVVGIAFIAVAAASAGVALLLPPAPGNLEVSTQVPGIALEPGEAHGVLLAGTNSSDGSFSVSWQSSSPVSSSLYEGAGCGAVGPGCARTDLVASWPANSSGHFGQSGSMVFPYLLVLTDTGGAEVTAQVSAVSHASVPATTSMLALVLPLVSAVALGLVGAVGLFFGLFLRPNVYRAPRRLVSQHADDAAGIADSYRPVTAPRTGSSDGGSGPPPPGPPARGR
jgi:hypothetical protein